MGYSEDELLATNFQSITHPDDVENDLANEKRMLNREIEIIQREKRYLHKNGSVVWALLNVSMVWSENGNPRHFISQVQDITERVGLEERLRQSQKMEAIGRLNRRRGLTISTIN